MYCYNSYKKEHVSRRSYYAKITTHSGCFHHEHYTVASRGHRRNIPGADSKIPKDAYIDYKPQTTPLNRMWPIM